MAAESGRPLGESPDVTETEIFVLTIAELTLGVLRTNDRHRPNCVATSSAVGSTWDTRFP